MTIQSADEKKCLFLSLFIFFIHLISIKFYPVNFEFSFSEGAKYFKDFEKSVIDEYFFNQANTFAFPLLVGLIDKLFFIEDTLVTARILSASSYIFFSLGFIKIFRHYKIKLSCTFFIFYFFLNPLIWTYGHRGIPDLFAASTAFYFFSNILILTNIKSAKSYINFFLLGLSICIKPFCFIYLGLIFLLKFNNNMVLFFKKFTIPYFITLILPITYFILVKKYYNFYLIPDSFSSDIVLFKGGLLNNFFGYLIFLSLFTIPLSFKKSFIKFKNFFIIIFIILPLSFYLGYMIDTPQAELNFGFLNAILGNEVLFLIGGISFLILFLFIYDFVKKDLLIKNKTNIEFLIIVFIYIFVLSFTRPSQRYLIIILPLIMIFFLTNRSFFNYKKIFALVSISFIFMNILIFVNFYFNSSINKIIVEYLANQEILKKTSPGPLYAHSYHFFSSNDKKFYLITTEPKDYIKKFEKGFFIFKKKYYLKQI